MVNVKNTFKKAERLTSKNILDDIFKEGKTIKKFPFIVKHLPCKFEDDEKLKVVISVPKRRIKNAVNRNRIRRLIKEAYRLNKANLKIVLEKYEKGLALFFIYTGKENPDYATIEMKIKLLLNELIRIYDKNNEI